MATATHWRVTADNVILCHVLTHKAAEASCTSRLWAMTNDKGDTTGFLQCRSRFATRFKACIGICAPAGS